MKNMQPHYEINERSIALIPVNHTDYQTLAIETDKKLYIKKTPFEIIERGCLDNFSSFEGRRKSITHLTGFKRKTPIPISVYRNIFVFPTHGYKDLSCCWIFPKHIESIVEKKINDNKSIILFKNGLEVSVEVSRRDLIKQWERTSFLLSIIM